MIKKIVLGLFLVSSLAIVSCAYSFTDGKEFKSLSIGLNFPAWSLVQTTPIMEGSRLMPGATSIQVKITQGNEVLADDLYNFTFKADNSATVDINVTRLYLDQLVKIDATARQGGRLGSVVATGSMTIDPIGYNLIFLEMIPVHSASVAINTPSNFNPFNDPIVRLVPGTGSKLNFTGMSGAKFFFYLQDAITGKMLHSEYISSFSGWSFTQTYSPGQTFIASMILASGGQSNDSIDMTVSP